MPWSRPVAWAAATAVLLAGPAAPAVAGFVVVANHTGQDVRFDVLHAGARPRAETLPSGAAKVVPTGQQPEIAFTANGKPVRFGLDPYSAYVFTGANGAIALHGVELAGALPKPDDVPGLPLDLGRLRIAVQILVDDADVRARAGWEKALRQRVAAASEILERQCGARLDVVAVGEWPSAPDAADVSALLKDFEQKVKPEGGAVVAVGFASRRFSKDDKAVDLAGCRRGPFQARILVRETAPRTEPERVEVLVHEFGHFLGAAHAPVRSSAMRPKLGDGLALSARHRVELDPLNLLAVGLWVEEVRDGKARTWEDLRPVTRERLRVVYKTLARLTPDDPVATEFANILENLRDPAAVAANPGPGGAGGGAQPAQMPDRKGGGGGGAALKDPVRPPDDGGDGEVLPPRPKDTLPAAPKMTAQEEAVRKVVRSVALRAGDLTRLAPADRPKGDLLTAEYVKAAADIAVTVDDTLQAPAFLLGLGIALDDSTTLRDNPVTGKLCRAAESDEERRERVAALGVPTVRSRRDLCQHFAISAALTEVLGPGGAEAVGLSKEMVDLGKPSGFSFCDLAADFAGVAFAKKVKADRGLIGAYRDDFKVEQFVPTVTGLREGLTPQRFEADYGTVDDVRFKAAVDDVRKRVAETPAYRK